MTCGDEALSLLLSQASTYNLTDNGVFLQCTYCLKDHNCLPAELYPKQKHQCCSAQACVAHAMIVLHFSTYIHCVWDIYISSILNQAADILCTATLNSTVQCTSAGLQQSKWLRQGHSDKHLPVAQVHGSYHCYHTLIDEANSNMSIDTVCAALFKCDESEQSEAMQLLVTVTYMNVNSIHVCPMLYESLNNVWSTVCGSKAQRVLVLHEGKSYFLDFRCERKSAGTTPPACHVLL